MEKNNAPDKLAQEVAQALAAGMSYGKWKALQPRAEENAQAIPDGWKACAHCGKPFKFAQGGKRFCCIECREEAYYLRTGKTAKGYAAK